MEIAVIGTESLGVRGLCCLVRAGGRIILIDPGVALGYTRNGLLPHPCQVAVGDAVRERIISAYSEATDIVISHYHGDHVPLVDANPYQLSLSRLPCPQGAGFWCKGPSGLSPASLRRREDLIGHMGRRPFDAEGIRGSLLSFSGPVPHGPPQSRSGAVMMTCIREGALSFVHASDIQLLNREAVDWIIEWRPDIVIASGPPLYLNRISAEERESAREFAMELANAVGVLILDHHLLRSQEGLEWLEDISAKSGGNIICAADFMERRRNLLEAGRERMYEKKPVPEGWHEAYAEGRAGYREYLDAGTERDIAEFRREKTIDISRVKPV